MGGLCYNAMHILWKRSGCFDSDREGLGDKGKLGMDNEKIKEMLLDIQESKLEFSVVMTGKESKRVNGLYKPETREILLHNKNFKTDNELIYTAVHEYTHHLINEERIEESGGREPPHGGRVHNNAFWAKFHGLLEIAEEKGYYKMDLASSPELEELTKEIKEKYIVPNGRLMQEFGKKLIQAHNLCDECNIRFEDCLDRILQILASLESRSLASRNILHLAGAGVLALLGSTLTNLEHAKASQCNLIALNQSVLDALENSVNKYTSVLLGLTGLLCNCLNQFCFFHGVHPP